MPNHENLALNSNVIKGSIVLITLVGIGVITVHLLGGTVLYDLELSPEDYMGIFSHLAILALITERFVEIFTSVIRKPDRVVLEGDLREADGPENKAKALDTLESYKAKTGVFTITISFITGLVIASVGVRILDPLFDTNELTSAQSLFFDGIDIVITAGLIAGGSKGINSLTSSIGAVFDAMKYQSRATEEKAKKDVST